MVGPVRCNQACTGQQHIFPDPFHSFPPPLSLTSLSCELPAPFLPSPLLPKDAGSGRYCSTGGRRSGAALCPWRSLQGSI
ncbi:hypothetical protein ZWY2020_043356 [Hordeum vulgare]|nr:hypothetical protein ZWY2020_043356 [Hordeum vulgare]